MLKNKRSILLILQLKITEKQLLEKQTKTHRRQIIFILALANSHPYFSLFLAKKELKKLFNDFFYNCC